MIFLLNLIKVEIKRVLRFLPHIMAGALALCFIIGIISFSASKVLYEKKDKNKVNIAISMPKGEQSAKIFISIVKDMKSIKENCNFIEVDDEKTAYKKVEEGGAYGAIIIPKHFISDIMNGTNTPVTVVLPNNSSIESMLIKDLIDGGTKSLTSAQAGIYAIEYEYEQAYHERLTKALQYNINVKYMDHTLQRENYFNHNKVYVTGELTALEYYICSGIVLLMLLLGITFSKYLCPSNDSFYDKLKAYGISKGIVTITRIISVFIVYMMIAIMTFIVYVVVYEFLGNDIKIFRVIDYIEILFILLSIASFIVCIFAVMESQISGTLLLFTAAIVMNFISGGFIPKVFLPRFIQSISPYVLNSILAKGIGNILLEKTDFRDVLLSFIICILIYGITIIILCIQDNIWSQGCSLFKGNILKVLLKGKRGK